MLFCVCYCLLLLLLLLLLLFVILLVLLVVPKSEMTRGTAVRTHGENGEERMVVPIRREMVGDGDTDGDTIFNNLLLLLLLLLLTSNSEWG